MDLASLHPVALAALAGTLTWLLTAAGATFVLFRRDMGRRTLDLLLGSAAGIMLAASYFSLLAPSIALGGWRPAVIGFLAGGLLMALVDRLLPHVHPLLPMSSREGLPATWRRSTLLVSAITLHNIPEGLAIGVAFGAAAQGATDATMAGAVALAVGIGLQNIPEGLAVAVPLRREGVSAPRAFLAGQASAVVEPFAAALGAAATFAAAPVLPYALAFAAGAMVFVVVEELIPESQTNGNADLATLGLLGGFALMMALDVAFG
ncbi:MAG TPA: ZIP family metal transporter [Candidatus Thermoplasmatota archaeon]|nr:ZIP family metal transporter [Candidatus Thermoplasmatota archaeon]